MPLTPQAVRTGTFSVRYYWSGVAPYDVWLDGVKVLAGSTLTNYAAQTTDGTTNPLPAIEVLDSTDTITAESKQYSPLVYFQWRGQSDASYYQVQQNIDAAWTPMAMIKEDGGGYYNFESTAQTDGIDAEFRVVPFDTRGYQGLPLPVTHRVTRNPAPPAVAYSYDDGTGNLTVEGI